MKSCWPNEAKMPTEDRAEYISENSFFRDGSWGACPPSYGLLECRS